MRILIFGCILLLVLAIAFSWAQQTGTAPGTGFPMPESKKQCTTCHTSHAMKKGTILLKKPLSELCLECHPSRIPPNDHKIDIVPTMKVDQLPLVDGKMTCVTCHDPHRNPYGSLLRMPERELCTLCHRY